MCEDEHGVRGGGTERMRGLESVRVTVRLHIIHGKSKAGACQMKRCQRPSRSKQNQAPERPHLVSHPSETGTIKKTNVEKNTPGPDQISGTKGRNLILWAELEAQFVV